MSGAEVGACSGCQPCQDCGHHVPKARIPALCEECAVRRPDTPGWVHAGEWRITLDDARAARDEESVDLTPGVVWTDAQLALVRDLTARAFRAEKALTRCLGLDPAEAEPAEVCPHGHRHLPPVLDRSCWPAVSPVPGQQREAVADELARHADTMAYTRDGDTVRLGCRCGHDRGTVTKAELATNLDGRMRAHRLHVADAVIGVLGGLLDVHTSRVNGDAITTDKEHT